MTRDSIDYYLEGAMARFQKVFEQGERAEAVKSEAVAGGIKYPIVGSAMFNAYAELDRFEGHLTEWTEGLSTFVLKDQVSEFNPGGQGQEDE